MSEKKVTLELTSDEALVFFDWLARFNRRDPVGIEDQAEQRVLFDLEAMLESTLTAPLEADYKGLLAAARGRVRDGG